MQGCTTVSKGTTSGQLAGRCLQAGLAQSNTQTGDMRILIVDDDLEMCEMLQRLLEADSYVALRR